jgi:hypothetical protein
MDWSTLIAALASLVTSVALFLSVVGVHRNVKTVKEDLSTVNGISIGGLAERAEGRRISHIPEVARTDAEQIYVDSLEAGGRDL